jgi:signal transduction histidine kinase
MPSIVILPLIVLSDLFRIDILFWLITLPIVAVLVCFLLWQYRQHQGLVSDMSVLNTVQHRNIEYDLVLKAMKLAVWHIDVQERTITYDADYRDALDVASIPPGSDVEMFCDNLLPVYKERIRTSMIDLLQGRTDHVHEQYQARSLQGDGTTWGETYAVVDKRDADGHPLTIVGTSMRIDKQKEIEMALIKARNQAEESDRMKTAFLANISHEVRTPLNAIVGFSEVLAGNPSDDERTMLSKLIRQNNARLLHIFDDVVNMSRLEAGGGSVSKQRFLVKDFLQEVVEKYAAQAAEKHLTLAVDAHSETLEPHTDRDRLLQIVCHYVENALKFTTAGSITIGANLEVGHMRVWVRDTGKGIEAEYCGDKLFERFVKVDEFEQGTGLGLSICRSLAIMLGGKVGMESELGVGSLFWVDVPYA